MSATLKALLVFSLLALPGYCGWILWTEKSSPQLRREERAPTSLPAKPLEDFRFSPREGTRYQYTFTRKLSFRGMNIPDMEYNGILIVDVLRTDRKGFTAVLSHRLTGHAQTAPVRFHARVDGNGKRVILRSTPPRDEEGRQHANILKDLIALWVFPLEADTVGQFRASFASLEGGWKKRKLAYEREGAPAIFHSEHWMLWGEGVPKELKGEERTHFAGGAMPLTTESTYGMELESLSPIPSGSERGEWSQAETLALVPGDRDALDPEDLGIHWERNREELLSVVSFTPRERLRVFGDTVRLLRSGKVTAREIRALLSREIIRLGASSPLFQTVVGALATAGGTEALSVLREIYSDEECPESGKGAVLAALTTTEAPIDEVTRDFLADLMKAEQNRDLADGAAFALGSSLQAAGSEASVAAAIRDIHSAWNGAQGNVAAQLALLDVMGNSGRAEFLPQIRSAMASGNDEAVQAKAIFSLRFFEGGEATTLLSSQLGNPTPALREAAIEAARIGPWRESLRAPLKECSQAEPLERLRASCRSALLRGEGRLAEASN